LALTEVTTVSVEEIWAVVTWSEAVDHLAA